MRKMVLGTYDTERNGPWVLTAWELSAAEHRTEYVTVPGRDGDLDVSTSLTDGVPKYGNRTLDATFETSEGSRLDREQLISTMVNWLDGWRVDIVLPDDAEHYLTGRVHVVKNYNDLAHASVSVEAVVDPWRYNVNETIHELTATTEEQTGRLTNYGRRTVVPLLTISGEGASVRLRFGSAVWQLSAGVYQLPDLVLPPGGADIIYSGSGVASFRYREAVL